VLTLITIASAELRSKHNNAVRALSILGRVERHVQGQPKALALVLAAMVRASWDLEQQRM
jgi:hypothetical protein